MYQTSLTRLTIIIIKVNFVDYRITSIYTTTGEISAI